MNPRRSILVPALLTLFATAATALETPPQLAEAVARAERLGKALAEAVPSSSAASKATLQLAKEHGAELCDFTYKQVLIEDGGAQLSYLIATTKNPADILLGRHFRLADSDAQPSTRSCFNAVVPEGKRNKTAAFSVTHILSPAPSEYHVYVSLKQPVPLMVITGAGLWSVTMGRIALERQEDTGLASNAPPDRPQGIAERQKAAFEAAIAPHVAKGRATYPAARDRYLAGLPRGETFFVTTRLRDKNGRMEQVFIRVSKIAGSEISGQIANDINTVVGFRRGQEYKFTDSELLDWLIAKPDGTEEGNVVGKFLDTYKP